MYFDFSKFFDYYEIFWACIAINKSVAVAVALVIPG